GIRDFHVTGVQTCALPISKVAKKNGISSDASTGNSNSIGPNTRTWSRSRSPFHLRFWLAPWSHISTFSRLPGGLSLLMSRKLGRSEEHTSELQSRENLVCR